MNKKILLLLFLGLCLFSKVNLVSADTYLYSSYDSVQSIQNEMLGKGIVDNVYEKYQEILSYYQENYSIDYPYYFVLTTWDYDTSYTADNHYKFVIDIYMSKYSSFASLKDTTMIIKTFRNYMNSEDENGKYKLLSINGYSTSTLDFSWKDIKLDDKLYDDFNYYYHVIQNYDYGGKKEIISALYDTNDPVFYTNNLEPYVTIFDKIEFAGIEDWEVSNFSVKENEMLPTIYGVYNGEYSFPIDSLSKIILNDYAYIVMVPKYEKILNDIRSTIYYNGQVCITPVLNFGQTEIETFSGQCTNKVSIPTMNSISITNTDLSKRTVFYVEPYTIGVTNELYYDSNYFDIVYIKDDIEPQINFNDKTYYGLKLSELKTTAKTNERNGVISGGSDYFDPLGSTSNSFTGVISSATNFFKSIVSDFGNFMSLVVSLFASFPVEFQNLIFSSFSIALVIGIIKIIL